MVLWGVREYTSKVKDFDQRELPHRAIRGRYGHGSLEYSSFPRNPCIEALQDAKETRRPDGTIRVFVVFVSCGHFRGGPSLILRLAKAEFVSGTLL